MTAAELGFFAVLSAVSLACSGGAAWLVARLFILGRRYPRVVLAVGFLLGLLFTPLAMVTVGTIGAGYWDLLGLPGGPLVGVVAAISAACALATALVVLASLIIWSSANSAARRGQLMSGRQ